jgi:lysylphosphatidylglycerol synthetase-like protein (DUF2156 family)
MTIATTANASLKTASTIDALLKKYATQLTAALAVVIVITGVMMFFSVYKRQVEALHEWLGMAFVLAVVLHLTRHRKPLLTMLSQSRMRILILLTALIAAALIGFPSSKESNPIKQMIGAVLRAPIGEVAPVLGVSAEDAMTRLTAAGAKTPRRLNPSRCLRAPARLNR